MLVVYASMGTHYVNSAIASIIGLPKCKTDSTILLIVDDDMIEIVNANLQCKTLFDTPNT